MKILSIKLLSFVLFLMTSLVGFSQKKIESPRDSVSGKINKANIVINYGSPSVKGRPIWGELVPYDKVWRAGANEATTFSTDQAIKVEGKYLPAGKYAFFAIPGKSEWTLIFNKTANQWGAYEYKAANDALRIVVKSKKSGSMQERLIYRINNNSVMLLWENLEIPFTIQ